MYQSSPIAAPKSPTHLFFSISLWVDLKEGTIWKKIIFIFVLKDYFNTNKIILTSFFPQLVGEKTEKEGKKNLSGLY